MPPRPSPTRPDRRGERPAACMDRACSLYKANHGTERKSIGATPDRVERSARPGRGCGIRSRAASEAATAAPGAHAAGVDAGLVAVLDAVGARGRLAHEPRAHPAHAVAGADTGALVRASAARRPTAISGGFQPVLNLVGAGRREAGVLGAGDAGVRAGQTADPAGAIGVGAA